MDSLLLFGLQNSHALFIPYDINEELNQWKELKCDILTLILVIKDNTKSNRWNLAEHLEC
jgi:hypothetical protein